VPFPLLTHFTAGIDRGPAACDMRHIRRHLPGRTRTPT